MSADSWYNGRPVCVFGASGFIGSALIRQLVAAGATVRAVARGLATPATLPPGAAFLQGDILHQEDVAAAVDGAAVIFVCAGRSGAAVSAADPVADLETNVRGLITVLEAVKTRPNPPKVVFPSSRLVYGTPDRIPVDETAHPHPASPYALNKLQCEGYLALYARLYRVPYAAARITNPYGPAPAPAWRGYNVLNTMLMRILRGESVTVYGDGAQLRDYIFIDDVVAALMRLGQPDVADVVVNVGSGTGRSVVSAVEEFIRQAGCGAFEFAPWPVDARAVESGDFIAAIDAMRAFGWEPKTSFEQGVGLSIASLKQP